MTDRDDEREAQEAERAKEHATPDLPGKDTKSGKAMIGIVVVIVLIVAAMAWWGISQFQDQEFDLPPPEPDTTPEAFVTAPVPGFLR